VLERANFFSCLEKKKKKKKKKKKNCQGLLLGQGSFGAVYEAYNIKDRKTVALKICSSTRKKSLDKMKMHAIDQVEQEVRILSSLPRSPFIVDFIDSVTLEAEQSVLVSFALIQGENLHQLVSNQGSLPVAQVRHVMWCLMKAMEHLQQNGIIHGDVKPENVIFSIDKQARLSDFGCACRIEDCKRQTNERLYVCVGSRFHFLAGTAERFRNLATVSPAFQSPEFANGQAEEGTEVRGRKKERKKKERSSTTTQ
jgi:serine/threonine protein kinase